MHWAFAHTRRVFLQATTAAAIAAGPFLPTAALAAEPKKKLVIVAGKPSHGPGAHEFNAGALLIKACLANTPDLEVVVHLSGWPKEGEKAFEGASGVLIYADGGGGHPALQGKNLEFLGSLMKQGVGLMCAHYAVEVPKDKGADEFRAWIGGCYEHMFSCNPMWKPEFAEFPQHEVTRGVKPFSVTDEWYINMRFRPDMLGVTSLLASKPSDQVRDGPYVYPKGPYPHVQANKGKPETMMWAVERPDGGRGVGFTGGHVHKNWGDDNYRKVVLNALLWICKVPVPTDGVESKVDEVLLGSNLDPKGPKKKP